MRNALVLFGIAVLVRFVGIGWGLPNPEHHFSYHPDEWLVLIVSYFTLNPYGGEWIPGFYNYGSLPLYLWSLWLHWLSTAGVIPIPSETASPDQIAEWRASLHLWARVLTALMAGGTTVIVARTAARVAGEQAGWVAGLVIAFAPAFVVHARFQTVDVPTTFFVALALAQSVALIYSERPWRTLLWGAVWAGCAAGSKYNAGLVALALMLSWGVRLRTEGGVPQRLLSILSGVALAGSVTVGVFLLTCPGSWADSARFWRDFGYELRHVQQGHGEVFTDTGLGWLYHLHPNLTTGFTTIALVASLIGWLMNGIRTPALWGTLGFTFAYFLLIGSAEVRFLRYTFPMFPALAIGMGTLVAEKASQQPMIRRALWLLVGISLLFQMIRSVDYTLCMLRTDARDQAVAWIRQHLPEGVSIGFPTVPWFYTPPLFPNGGELRWQDRLARLAEAPSPYRLVSLAPPEWNAEALQRVRPDYVLISEFEARDVARIGRADYRAFMQVLEREYELIQHFRNDPPLLRRSPQFPHDMLYICPSVDLWRRKN